LWSATESTDLFHRPGRILVLLGEAGGTGVVAV
jgi:hypothetical protein